MLLRHLRYAHTLISIILHLLPGRRYSHLTSVAMMILCAFEEVLCVLACLHFTIFYVFTCRYFTIFSDDLRRWSCIIDDASGLWYFADVAFLLTRYAFCTGIESGGKSFDVASFYTRRYSFIVIVFMVRMYVSCCCVFVTVVVLHMLHGAFCDSTSCCAICTLLFVDTCTVVCVFVAFAFYQLMLLRRRFALRCVC